MRNFLVVLKKELKDVFRDRKTLIFALILPMLLYPVMFKIMGNATNDMLDVENKTIMVSTNAGENTTVHKLLSEQKNIEIKNISEDSIDTALKDGDISVYISVPQNFEENLSNGIVSNIDLKYDGKSKDASMEAMYINELLNGVNDSIVKTRLAEKGIDESILTPFNITKTTLEADNELVSMMLSMLPTLIVVLMISPTLGIAADLVAGEKERGTFEPLLSTAGSRSAILWGKVTTMSILGLMALVMGVVSIVYSLNEFMAGEGSITMEPGAVAIILLVGLLLIITLTALEVAVGIYARSVKEAGTYLSGLTMPVMILSFIPYMMDAKSMSTVLFNIPVINSIAVMKEAIVGIYDTSHIIMVIAWHIVYVVAAVLFARFMFSREEVIFRS